MKLYSMSYNSLLLYRLHLENFNLLYEAIFYVLCLTNSALFILAIYFNLLYEAIFYVLVNIKGELLADHLISIFFMKLYSMSYWFWNRSDSLLYKISIFFMKLYSMSFKGLSRSCSHQLVISIFFMKLYSMSFYKGMEFEEFIIHLFQSSLWSYILCPSRFRIRFNKGKWRFQSSLWSYILCPYLKRRKNSRNYVKFQSSLWSYILCPLKKNIG